MTEKELHVGDKAADGWIYAGESPDTHKPMYVAPRDVIASCYWDEANQMADAVAKQTGKEVRLPTKGELKQMFDNKAKIGGFNETGFLVGGTYWSSSEEADDKVVTQSFSDGRQIVDTKYMSGPVARFVRS